MDANATLPEPHFDEEATVLSARPVVPLEKVRSFKTGRFATRPWILALSVAGALMVGVFATVLYYSRSSEDNLSVLEEIEVASGAAGISDDPADSFSGPASPQVKPETDKSAVVNPAVENRPSVRVTNDSSKKPQPRLVAVIKDRKSNEVDDVQESRIDRIDRKEARRQARREQRLGDRERRNGNPSEVLRIRDIFEGSPRP